MLLPDVGVAADPGVPLRTPQRHLGTLALSRARGYAVDGQENEVGLTLHRCPRPVTAANAACAESFQLAESGYLFRHSFPAD
jgi:hypothetical protein